MLGTRMVQAMDLHTALDFNKDHGAILPKLPLEKKFYVLLDRVMATTLLCHDCLNQHDIDKRLPRLYALGLENYLMEDQQFVALVYAVVACGKRYSSEADPDQNERGSVI